MYMYIVLTIATLSIVHWPHLHCAVQYNTFTTICLYVHTIFSVEEERVSASSIANDKTSASRATGWKVHHLDPQLGDVVSYRQLMHQPHFTKSPLPPSVPPSVSLFLPTPTLSHTLSLTLPPPPTLSPSLHPTLCIAAGRGEDSGHYEKARRKCL